MLTVTELVGIDGADALELEGRQLDALWINSSNRAWMFSRSSSLGASLFCSLLWSYTAFFYISCRTKKSSSGASDPLFCFRMASMRASSLSTLWTNAMAASTSFMPGLTGRDRWSRMISSTTLSTECKEGPISRESFSKPDRGGLLGGSDKGKRDHPRACK